MQASKPPKRSKGIALHSVVISVDDILEKQAQ